MAHDRAAFKKYIHQMIQDEWKEQGSTGLCQLLERGREFQLADVLTSGGAVLFPHAAIARCGHQTAAAVHAAIDSGADRVLAVGVLHALSDEMKAARVRVAQGSDPSQEEMWGIQRPGLEGHTQWESEFSLLHFQKLWETEIKRRKIKGPELIMRYPYLAGGKPEQLPNMAELQEIAKDAVVVTTADAFHHGIGYGDSTEKALDPERGGLELAKKRINEGLALLQKGEYWKFNQHCVEAKSDGRDAGQVVRYLLGPLTGKIFDITYADTTAMYSAPPPTWVAAALVELRGA
jgi:hypothetical protein